jgi:hypothetical protein
MHEIVKWQIGLETAAAQFYRLAASRFAHEPELSAFLRELAEQEIAHAELLRQVATDGQIELAAAPLLLNRETCSRIEGQAALARGAVQGELDRPGLFRAMIAINFPSGTIFLYSALRKAVDARLERRQLPLEVPASEPSAGERKLSSGQH